jgi:hypothetical protein
MTDTLLPCVPRTAIAASGSARVKLSHAGSGAPLRLMHGTVRTHGGWHRVAPHLAEGLPAVATDLRGGGLRCGHPRPEHAPQEVLDRLVHCFGDAA